MVFKDFKEIFSTPEKNAQKYKNKLKEHENVPRMGELKKLLDYAEKNNTLTEFNSLAYEFQNMEKNSEFDRTAFFSFSFYQSSKNILGGELKLIKNRKKQLTDNDGLNALLYLLYLNYYKFSNKKESIEEIINKCSSGKFIEKLILETIDFKQNRNIENNYDEFLIRLKHINFENDEVEEFNNIIISYITYVIGEDTSLRFFNHISFGAIHLMACSAAKNNRNVTYEDVVIGYLLIFKILTEDLTSYINQLYHGD